MFLAILTYVFTHKKRSWVMFLAGLDLGFSLKTVDQQYEQQSTDLLGKQYTSLRHPSPSLHDTDLYYL